MLQGLAVSKAHTVQNVMVPQRVVFPSGPLAMKSQRQSNRQHAVSPQDSHLDQMVLDASFRYDREGVDLVWGFFSKQVEPGCSTGSSKPTLGFLAANITMKFAVSFLGC